MISHNKKRNVFLLYEFLNHSLVTSIINNEQEQVKIKLALLKEHFSKDSEIKKEYKLMKALYEMHVANDSTINRIFDDVKAFAIKIDYKKLNKEKTKLINEIHNKVKDESFYKYKVGDYTLIATIHNLVEEYRKQDAETEICIAASLFEDSIKTHLKERKENSNNKQEITENKSYDKLTMKIAVDKFSERYKNLNNLQKNLLNEFIANNDEDKLLSLVIEAREEICKKISEIEKDADILKDADVSSKLTRVKESVNAMVLDEYDDKLITEMISYGEILNYVTK